MPICGTTIQIQQSMGGNHVTGRKKGVTRQEIQLYSLDTHRRHARNATHTETRAATKRHRRRVFTARHKTFILLAWSKSVFRIKSSHCADVHVFTGMIWAVHIVTQGWSTRGEVWYARRAARSFAEQRAKTSFSGTKPEAIRRCSGLGDTGIM